MCDTLEEDIWSVGVCKEIHHILSVTVSYCTVLYIKNWFHLFKNIGRNILVLFMFFQHMQSSLHENTLAVFPASNFFFSQWMKPKRCSTVPKQLTLMNLFFLMNLSMTQVNLQLRFDDSHWLNQLEQLVIYHLTQSLNHRSLVLTIFNSKWTKNCYCVEVSMKWKFSPSIFLNAFYLSYCE